MKIRDKTGTKVELWCTPGVVKKCSIQANTIFRVEIDFLMTANVRPSYLL